MSSLQKTGLAQKTGAVVLGATLLSSLMLTACGAPSNSDSKSQPAASASSSAAPKDLEQFDVGDAFDLGKQSTVDFSKLTGSSAKTSEFPVRLLTDGVVYPKKGDKGNVTIAYAPYEGTDGAWEFASEIPYGDAATNPASRMRWKGKSYLVLNWESKTSEPASGLKAAKTLVTPNVVVLDATTGKVVNTIKGDANEQGTNTPGGVFYLDNTPKTGSQNATTVINDPFMVGLVFRNVSTGDVKLVDPLTSATLDTANAIGQSAPSNNETGFYSIAKIDANIDGLQGVFGNYILAVTEQPKLNGALNNAKFSLIDTVTKKVISEIKCLDSTKAEIAYSANFRYVSFGGNYVFDTQTGKSFCARPTGQTDVRPFVVSAIDNNGLMYGLATNGTGGKEDYLRVDIADNTKMETLKESVKTSLPARIDSKGSAIYFSKKSDAALVVVPSKTSTK